MDSLSRNQSIAEKAPFVLPPAVLRENNKAAGNKNQPVRVGIYCRLSREDGTDHASVSIENQQTFLSLYAREREWDVYDVYTDDGVSGTTFDRDDLNRLMRDCESGRVNTILVKDLSRFGRDYVKMGEMEEYFKARNIRFIAVQDNVDSLAGYDTLMTSIRNILNENHAADTSRKIRLARRVAAGQGKYMGSYPPFGYSKHPENKYLLIPSEDAPIVAEIFRRVDEGETMREICDDLNARKVITPSLRIAVSYGGSMNRTPTSEVWTTTTVARLLDNEKYIGHMIQGKRTTVSHKNKNRISVDLDDQILVENTHEAIVPVEVWNRIQEKRKKQSVPRKRKNRSELNLFAGFAYCADCGSVLAATTKPNKTEEYHLLRCARYNNAGKNACSGHTIRYDALYALLLHDIQKHTKLVAEDEQALIDRLYRSLLDGEAKDAKARDRQIAALKAKLNALQTRVEKLYEEKWERGMPEEIFQSMSKRYAAEKSEFEAKLESLEAEAVKTRDTEEDIARWMEAIRKCIGVKMLDRKILGLLVDRVVVHEKMIVDGVKRQKVEIFYRFVGRISDG